MVYPKAKLKNNGGRESSCCKSFLIGSTSEKFFPNGILIKVSLRHIFISLTSLMGIPNSMRIFYKTSLLTE